MGQGASSAGPPPSVEQLSTLLAERFAKKSFTPLELYCFNSVFRSLADDESGIRYWSESTLCRFLELPDALGAGSVVFHMASYLGAFPFASMAPAILTHDALLKVVTILTKRHGSVIKRREDYMWRREIYRSLAIHDKGIRAEVEEKEEGQRTPTTAGFAVDVPGDDNDESDSDDELVLAALDSMDSLDVFKHGEHVNVHHSIIPTDNLLKLVELLLLIAPIDAQQSLSSLAPDLTDDRIESLRCVAHNVLSSFGVDDQPGVPYRIFDAVLASTLPNLFDGLNPLFEHFLFARDFDLAKRNPASSPAVETHPVIAPAIPDPEPILRTPGEILDLTLLSQLSFFIKGSELFRRLRPLYSGNTHGFSMGSFETHVFNWRAPTILLVSGRLLPSTPSTSAERAIADALPPARHSPSTTPDQTLTYGAYIPAPWKHTPKACFSDKDTKLFQLAPTHDVFAASPINTSYAYFNRSPTIPGGLGLGTPIPPQSSAHSYSHSAPVFRPAPVSLHVDDGLEFGVFTHLSEGGGSFYPSSLPGRRGKTWQDRFSVERMEVWGCGGDEVAEAQRREWAFEAREAEARRRINLGTGDQEADYELLRLAGLVGAERSGGSMG